MGLLPGVPIPLTFLLFLVSVPLAWSLPAARTPGMFSWLFSPPSLSVPEDTRSLAWEMLVDDAPAPPPNTLEYELDTIQELFSDVAFEREVAWARYARSLTEGLRSGLT